MNSFKTCLSGPNAFYKQRNYTHTTSTEMRADKAPNTPAYTHNTETKIWRIVKDIFSVLIFPIGLYRLTHSLMGKYAILPAATPALIGRPANYATQARRQLSLSNEWKVKRLSIKVDGYTIDAAIMGKATTLGNCRWVLSSNGNAQYYEESLQDRTFKQILTELNGNAIVFNYPGVGGSSGMPNRAAMSKAYRAILHFLEDSKKGIGAKEIIGYGHSIGGGVQGDALNTHKLKQGIKYCFVKSRTFSDLSTTVADLTGSSILGYLVRFFGWNISSIDSSKKLQAPEIIIQTATVNEYTDIAGEPEKIAHDGIISSEASLARRLLDDGEPLLGNKYYMGIPETHNYPFRDPWHLVERINSMLETA